MEMAAGVMVTSAAGNDANLTSRHIPAAYPEVVSAGSLTDYDGMPGGLSAVKSCG